MDPLDALIAIAIVIIICYWTFRFVAFASKTFKSALKAINDDDNMDNDQIICDDCYMYLADTLDSEKSIDISRNCENCGTKFSILTKKRN